MQAELFDDDPALSVYVSGRVPREPTYIAVCGHLAKVGFGKRFTQVQRQRYMTELEDAPCADCKDLETE